MEYANGILYLHHSSVGKPGMLADLHCHNRFELLYISSGQMSHVVEDRKYTVCGGDLVLVRPSTYHYLEQLTAETYDRYNILFDPEQIGVNVGSLPEDTEVISLLNNPIAIGLFQKIDFYRNGLSPEDFSAFLAMLLRELFLNLRIFSNPHHREKTMISPILTRALDYINENLFTITDVEQIAQALYISPSYLFYLFRTALHQTPKKYITDKRLLAAQQQIRGGDKPTEVYQVCGFRDYTTFFRSYTAYFGHTPSQEGKQSSLYSF